MHKGKDQAPCVQLRLVSHGDLFFNDRARNAHPVNLAPHDNEMKRNKRKSKKIKSKKIKKRKSKENQRREKKRNGTKRIVYMYKYMYANFVGRRPTFIE